MAPRLFASESILADTNAAVAVTLSTNRMDLLDDKYRLAAGDRLSFRILEDQTEPSSLVVTDFGEIEVPYIGRVAASGKTCRELARAVKAELDKEYFYNATVIIAVDGMTQIRGKIYLVGPIRTPGPQDLPSTESLTLSEAILRAGGFADYADTRNVRVIRKGSGKTPKDQTFNVDVSKILEQGNTNADLELEPGDVIYVSQRLVRF